MRKAFGIAMTFIGVVAACGGGGNGGESKVPTTPANTTKFCDAVCATRKTCGKGSDDAACHASCEKDLTGRRVALFRPAVVDDMIACAKDSACREPKDCLDRERETVADTPKFIEACKRMDAFVARCGDTPRPCNKGYKLVDERTLDRMTACTEEACRSGLNCVHGVQDAVQDALGN